MSYECFVPDISDVLTDARRFSMNPVCEALTLHIILSVTAVQIELSISEKLRIAASHKPARGIYK